MEAWDDLRSLHSLWVGILPKWQHHQVCERLMRDHSLSFWDALLIATALEEGVTTLYSEDFTGVGPIGTLQIINPFL